MATGDPPLAPSPAASPLLDYHGPDGPAKPPGMIVWGVILCILAAGAGCMTAVMPLSLMAPPEQRPTTATLVTGIAVYLSFAVALTFVAVACLQARRWVPKVMLALAWPVLVIGLLTVPISTASAAMTEIPPGTPPAARIVAVASVLIMGLALMIALPIAAIWYFSRPALRDRLLDYQPDAVWTDGLPVRVLSLALWMALTGLWLLAAIPMATAPLFGVLLSGLPAVLVLLIKAGAALGSAWLAFQARLAGWWLALAVLVVLLGSALVTTLRIGAAEMAGANLPEAQRAVLETNPLMSTPIQASLTAGYLLAVVAAMLWVRRGFHPETVREPTAEMAASPTGLPPAGYTPGGG